MDFCIIDSETYEIITPTTSAKESRAKPDAHKSATASGKTAAGSSKKSSGSTKSNG